MIILMNSWRGNHSHQGTKTRRKKKEVLREYSWFGDFVAKNIGHQAPTRAPKLSPAAIASGEGLSLGAMAQMSKTSLWKKT